MLAHGTRGKHFPSPSHAAPGPHVRAPHASGKDVVTHGASGATHFPRLASETSHTIGAAHGVASGLRQSSSHAPRTHASPGFVQSDGTQDEAPVLTLLDCVAEELPTPPPLPGFVVSAQPAAGAAAAPAQSERSAIASLPTGVWVCTSRRYSPR